MLTAFIVWFVMTGFFMFAAQDTNDRVYYGGIFAIPAVLYLTAYYFHL